MQTMLHQNYSVQLPVYKASLSLPQNRASFTAPPALILASDSISALPLAFHGRVSLALSVACAAEIPTPPPALRRDANASGRPSLAFTRVRSASLSRTSLIVWDVLCRHAPFSIAGRLAEASFSTLRVVELVFFSSFACFSPYLTCQRAALISRSNAFSYPNFASRPPLCLDGPLALPSLSLVGPNLARPSLRRTTRPDCGTGIKAQIDRVARDGEDLPPVGRKL